MKGCVKESYIYITYRYCLPNDHQVARYGDTLQPYGISRPSHVIWAVFRFRRDPPWRGVACRMDGFYSQRAIPSLYLLSLEPTGVLSIHLRKG
jgi:hypothetical protein